MVALALAGQAAAAGEATLAVTAVVREFFSVRVAPAVAVFDVTPGDIARGYSDCVSNVNVEISTNARREVIIQVHPSGGSGFLSLRAAGADGSPSRGPATWTIAGGGRRHAESIRVAARMHLSHSSATGVYRIPLHVEAMPL